MVPAGNKATPFVGKPYHKNNSSSHVKDYFMAKASSEAEATFKTRKNCLT